MADPSNTGAAGAPNRRFLLSVAGLLMMIALGDVFRGQSGTEVTAQKEVPPAPKFASKLVGPTIKFLYCYS